MAQLHNLFSVNFTYYIYLFYNIFIKPNNFKLGGDTLHTCI